MPTPAPRLKLTIADTAAIVNQLAQLYKNFNRVAMEYPDNAIDDAEGMAHDNNGTYPYPVKVVVAVDTKKRTVTITDNCRGIPLAGLEGIAQSIGKSVKKGSPWLNGQFGFGVHAFRGFARRIKFQTKTRRGPHYQLEFTRDQEEFKGAKELDEKFPSDKGHGTRVVISDFDDDAFDGVDAAVIKEEIETHFERLLTKPDLSVVVEDVGGAGILPCKPFDYSAVQGKEFMLKEVVHSKDRDFEVDILLKVTDQPMPETRRPRIFRKGRRIMELKDLPTFYSQSKEKFAVWDHPHLTGYIEVGELLSPTITRSEISKADRKDARVVAGLILKLEEEVAAAIGEVNRKHSDDDFASLEQALTKALSKLAAEDRLKMRTALLADRQGNVLLEPGSSEGREGTGGPINDKGGGQGTGGSGEGDGFGPGGPGAGEMSGDNPGSDGSTQAGPGPAKGSQQKKSGFAIKFSNLPADVEGNMVRSHYIEGAIVINVGHPDFDTRLKHTSKGKIKLTERLLGYVAGVVSVHYKDQFYERYKNAPEARTQLFEDQLAFIVRFESALVPLMKSLEAMLEQDLAEAA